MTVLTFPSNPTNGQRYAAPNGIQYVFDGVKWIVEITTSSSEAVSNSTQDRVAPMFVNGDNTGITFTYNSATNVMSAEVTAVNGNTLVNGNKTATLGTDGEITAPFGKLGVTPQEEFGISADADTAAVIMSNDSAHKWTFETGGDLRLPVGGDIINSTGQSVLGGGAGVVNRTVVFPAGEAGDTAGTLANDSGTLYYSTGAYVDVNDIDKSFAVETTQNYDVSQSGGLLNSIRILAADYPGIKDILDTLNNTNTDYQTDFTVDGGPAFGGAQTVTEVSYNGTTIDFLWSHRTGVDPTTIEQGDAFTVGYTGTIPQPAIWTRILSSDISVEIYPNSSTELTVADKDFEIRTTRSNPGQDADIGIYAADDLWLEAAGDDVVISAANEVRINSNNENNSYEWTFDATGKLRLPENGDIVDINGNSVLGGTAGDANIWIQDFETTQGAPTDVVGMASSVEYLANGDIVALFIHYANFNQPGDNSYSSVARFTPAGEKLWSMAFQGSQYTDGWGLAVDNVNNFIYVAGRSDNNSGYDKATLTKLAQADGAIAWSKLYDVGYDNTNAVVDVATDGNPIVVGYAYNGTDNQIVTSKISAVNGSIIWSKAINGQGYDEAYGMAIGPSGEVVTVGYMDQVGVIDGAETLYTDPVSNPNWITNQTNVFTGQDGIGIRFDVSFTDGVPTFSNIVDTAGSRTVDGTVATISGVSFGGATPADDMTVKVGTLIANDTKNRILVVKYADNGTIAWQKAVTVDAGFDCQGADADIDGDGNIYVCSSFSIDNSSPWLTAMIIIKFDSSGVKQWTRKVQGDCQDFASSIVVGPDNCLYLSGITASNGQQDFSMVIAKYNLDGTVAWQRLLDNTTTWTFAGGSFFGPGGSGSTIAVRDGYVAVVGGFADPGGTIPHAILAQFNANGATFPAGDYDFKAASFSGLLNGSASNIIVFDAGKTSSDYANAFDVFDFDPDYDLTSDLVGTLYSTTRSNKLTNGEYEFSLNNDGSIKLPNLNNTGYEPFYQLNGPTLELSNDPASQVIITGPAPDDNNRSAQRLVIQGQKGFGGTNTAGEGGDIYIWGGVGGEATQDQAPGNGGDIKVRGGAGQYGGSGGYVKVEGGDSFYGPNGNGGYVEITAGDRVNGGNGNGGDVTIKAGRGLGTGVGGAVFIDTINTAGNSKRWSFDYNGDLTLPPDGDIKNSTGSSVLGGDNGPTAQLVGDSYVSGTGYKYTVYTDLDGYQGGESDGVLVANSSYAVGDTVTFRNGEIRTLTSVQVDFGDPGVTWIEWNASVDGSNSDPRFPITVTSDDYAPETKLTARIKPDLSTEGSGQYMDVYVGGNAVLDNKHVHMAGHGADTELFLGTDNNFVSAKDAGASPARVNLKSENDITVSETNLRMTRGSTWANVYGDGENRNLHNSTYDLAWGSVDTDEQGNYYVGGEAANWSEAMVAKYGPDGELIWKKLVNGNTLNGWTVDGIAYNSADKEVAVAVQTDVNRSNDYYKVTVFDSETGESKRTFDIYDDDGHLNARAMKWHPTLGYVLVGDTFGETTSTGTITSIGATGVGIIELPRNSVKIGGAFPQIYSNWRLTGTGITGAQEIQPGVGLYQNVAVINTTNPSATGLTVGIRVDYTGLYYENFSSGSTGTGYTYGDAFKILGSSLGGVDGGLILSATQVTSNSEETFFSKDTYPTLNTTLNAVSGGALVKYAGNGAIGRVTAVRDVGDGNWGVAITMALGQIYGNGVVDFFAGNDFTGTIVDNSSIDNAGLTGIPSLTANYRLDMGYQMGYGATNFRTNLNSQAGTNYAFGEYRFYGDGVNSYFALGENSTDPVDATNKFRLGEVIIANATATGNQTITLAGGLGPIAGTPYTGWLLTANVLGGAGDYDINSFDFNGAFGTFTISTPLNSRAFVWTNSWSRFYNPKNNGQSFGNCVAVDPYDGGLVVGGQDDNYERGFVWKLSSLGVTAWVRGINNDSNQVRSVAVSAVNGAVYFTTSFGSLNKFTSEGTLLKRVQPNGSFDMYDPEVKLKQELDGIEYLYVGAQFDAQWIDNTGFVVSKLNSNLESIWSRDIWNNDGSIQTHYDQYHNIFALGKDKATLVGNTYIMSDNYYNGIVASISTSDTFDTHNKNNWHVESAGGFISYPNTTNTNGYDEFNFIADGATTATGSTSVALDTPTHEWNNWTWKSITANLNKTDNGIVGVESIKFADGGTLDHNPSDIPPAVTDFAQSGWNYTLQLSDRGRFIKNQEIPNDTYAQDLYITVPSNKNVSFPVGSVITLINTSSDSANGYRIYVEPEYYYDYNGDLSPRIWATGGNQNYSRWSFQGIQTVTLMKIGSNEWLLSGNNIENAD